MMTRKQVALQAKKDTPAAVGTPARLCTTCGDRDTPLSAHPCDTCGGFLANWHPAPTGQRPHAASQQVAQTPRLDACAHCLICDELRHRVARLQDENTRLRTESGAEKIEEAREKLLYAIQTVNAVGRRLQGLVGTDGLAAAPAAAPVAAQRPRPTYGDTTGARMAGILEEH